MLLNCSTIYDETDDMHIAQVSHHVRLPIKTRLYFVYMHYETPFKNNSDHISYYVIGSIGRCGTIFACL